MLSFEKTEEVFFKIWKDPVWSKVIAGGIIGGIAGIGAWAAFARASFNIVLAYITCILTIQVSLFWILLISWAILFIPYIWNKIYPKPSLPADSYNISNEVIGDYKLGELIEILSKEKVTQRTRLMDLHNIYFDKDDLLKLFKEFYTDLNRGVSGTSHFDEYGFLWGVLAPKLLDYGLTKKVDQAIFTREADDTTYIVSEDGRRFFSLLQRKELLINS